MINKSWTLNLIKKVKTEFYRGKIFEENFDNPPIEGELRVCDCYRHKKACRCKIKIN